MMGVWLFLKSGLGRGAVVGLVLVGLLVWGNVGYARLKRTKADLADAKALLYVPDARGKPTKVTWQARAVLLETNLGTCRSGLDTLGAAVEAQNKAVEAAKAEGDRRARALDQALQAARKEGMAAQANADRILGIRVRDGETCQRLLEAERKITEATR